MRNRLQVAGWALDGALAAVGDDPDAVDGDRGRGDGRQARGRPRRHRGLRPGDGDRRRRARSSRAPRSSGPTVTSAASSSTRSTPRRRCSTPVGSPSGCPATRSDATTAQSPRQRLERRHECRAPTTSHRLAAFDPRPALRRRRSPAVAVRARHGPGNLRCPAAELRHQPNRRGRLQRPLPRRAPFHHHHVPQRGLPLRTRWRLPVRRRRAVGCRRRCRARCGCSCTVGGIGYYDDEERYVAIGGTESANDAESTGQLLALLFDYVGTDGATDTFVADRLAAGDRFVLGSLCDHDLYVGVGQPYPHDPNHDDTVDGLLANLAMVDAVTNGTATVAGDGRRRRCGSSAPAPGPSAATPSPTTSALAASTSTDSCSTPGCSSSGADRTTASEWVTDAAILAKHGPYLADRSLWIDRAIADGFDVAAVRHRRGERRPCRGAERGSDGCACVARWSRRAISDDGDPAAATGPRVPGQHAHGHDAARHARSRKTCVPGTDSSPILGTGTGQIWGPRRRGSGCGAEAAQKSARRRTHTTLRRIVRTATATATTATSAGHHRA